MGEERRRAWERGWTVMEVLLVLFLLGALVAIALPNLHAARLRNNETAAVRTLRELLEVQEMMRLSCVVDEDRDGKGEFLFLEEVSGESNPRSFAPVNGSTAPVPLPQFRHKILPDGQAEICGYRFRVWLPGPGGIAVGEGSVAGDASPDPVLAGKFWCAYAWPVRREGRMPPPTGTRTLFASQVGEVLAAEAAYAAVPPGEGAPPLEPSPGAAFAAPGPLTTITGAPAMGTVGRDGNVWRTLE